MTLPEPDGTPDDGDLRTAWTLLNDAVTRVGARLARGMEAAGSVTLPQFDVLIRLHDEPSHRLAMAGLADTAGLSVSGFAKLANRMELDGLVICEPAADSSNIELVFTDHGHTLTDVALRHHSRGLRESLAAPLGPDRLQLLVDLTRTLRDSNR